MATTLSRSSKSDHAPVAASGCVEELVEEDEKPAQQPVDEARDQPARDAAHGEQAGPQAPKECGVFGRRVSSVAADLDVEQVGDRPDQELEGDQAADQGDAEAWQRFLVSLAFMSVRVRLQQDRAKGRAERQ